MAKKKIAEVLLILINEEGEWLKIGYTVWKRSWFSHGGLGPAVPDITYTGVSGH